MKNIIFFLLLKGLDGFPVPLDGVEVPSSFIFIVEVTLILPGVVPDKDTAPVGVVEDTWSEGIGTGTEVNV